MLQVLNATDKTAFINPPFQASNVQVQSTVNNQAMWIGANDTNRMLTILSGHRNGAANAKMSQGSVVNVTGMVQKVPSTVRARNQWHSSSSDANRLEQQGAYIQASQMPKAQQKRDAIKGLSR